MVDTWYNRKVSYSYQLITIFSKYVRHLAKFVYFYIVKKEYFENQ